MVLSFALFAISFLILISRYLPYTPKLSARISTRVIQVSKNLNICSSAMPLEIPNNHTLLRIWIIHDQGLWPIFLSHLRQNEALSNPNFVNRLLQHPLGAKPFSANFGWNFSTWCLKHKSALGVTFVLRRLTLVIMKPPLSLWESPTRCYCEANGKVNLLQSHVSENMNLPSNTLLRMEISTIGRNGAVLVRGLCHLVSCL